MQEATKETQEEKKKSWRNVINKLLDTYYENIDKHLAELLERNAALLAFSKWGTYLPEKFQVELLKNEYFDFVLMKLFKSANSFNELLDLSLLLLIKKLIASSLNGKFR